MKKKARIALWIKFGIFAALALFAIYLIISIVVCLCTSNPDTTEPTNFWEALGKAIGDGIERTMWIVLIITIVALVYLLIGVFVTLFTLYKLKTATKIEDMKGLPVVNLFLGGFVAGIIMLASNPYDWVDEGPEVTI